MSMFSKISVPSWLPGGGEAQEQHHSPGHDSKQAGQQHSKGEEEEEQSLTTVLSSREDRESLLLLVGDCTHQMRTTLCATFDPRQGQTTSNVLRKAAASGTKHDENQPLVDVSDDQNATATLEEASEQQSAEEIEKDLQRRATELAAPEMQELKKAALNHFDDWRNRVLERVGEAVNQKPASELVNKAQETKAIPEQPPTLTVGEDSISDIFAQLYPPQRTPLGSLPHAKRLLVLHSLVLLLLSLERYTSESRVLLIHLTSSLHLPLSALSTDESKIAHGLLEAAKKQMSADEETKRKAAEGSSSRAWKVGLGTVAGAALIGVTGGLAAPLLAAGVGSVMGGLGLGTTVAATYLGAMAGSAPLVGVLFGAYGGRMTGQAVDRYAKEVSDFAFIPVHESPKQAQDKHHHSFHNKASEKKEEELEASSRRLRVAIGISGYLVTPADITSPWLPLSAQTTEPFALRFELDAMLSLGNSLTAYIKSYAWGWAKKEIISRTIFATLSAGLWPLGLMKFSKVVDNPFSIARQRADKAGLVLADALMHRVQGERPVTLVGYSLGARVIYVALTALAERKAFGLVESVVLIGAATPSDSVRWRKLRAVVAGRIVNAYAANDYLLAFLYRTTALQLGVAGLQAVKDVPGVENVDVGALLTGSLGGHTQYRFLTGAILNEIGFEDLDTEQVTKQEDQRQIAEKKEEEKNKHAQAKQGGEAADVTDEHVEAVQKEAQKGKEQGMMGWVSGAFGSLGLSGGSGQGQEKKGMPSREEHLSEEEKLKHAGV